MMAWWEFYSGPVFFQLNELCEIMLGLLSDIDGAFSPYKTKRGVEHLALTFHYGYKQKPIIGESHYEMVLYHLISLTGGGGQELVLHQLL